MAATNENQAEQEAKAYQSRLDGVVAKLANAASQVGMCVLDRDNHLGANAGSPGAFLAGHFNGLAEAGYADRGGEALVVRELMNGPTPAKLENCAPGAVSVGAIQLPQRGMGS